LPSTDHLWNMLFVATIQSEKTSAMAGIWRNVGIRDFEPVSVLIGRTIEQRGK